MTSSLNEADRPTDLIGLHCFGDADRQAYRDRYNPRFPGLHIARTIPQLWLDGVIDGFAIAVCEHEDAVNPCDQCDRAYRCRGRVVWKCPRCGDLRNIKPIAIEFAPTSVEADQAAKTAKRTEGDHARREQQPIMRQRQRSRLIEAAIEAKVPTITAKQWFWLAAWGKRTQHLPPVLRVAAYLIGEALASGNRLTPNQKLQAVEILVEYHHKRNPADPHLFEISVE